MNQSKSMTIKKNATSEKLIAKERKNINAVDEKILKLLQKRVKSVKKYRNHQR